MFKLQTDWGIVNKRNWFSMNGSWIWQKRLQFNWSSQDGQQNKARLHFNWWFTHTLKVNIIVCAVLEQSKFNHCNALPCSLCTTEVQYQHSNLIIKFEWQQSLVRDSKICFHDSNFANQASCRGGIFWHRVSGPDFACRLSLLIWMFKIFGWA